MPPWSTEELLWRPSPLTEVGRYALALAIVLSLSTAAAIIVLRHQPDEQIASEADEAVLLDLPPALESSAPQRDVDEGRAQQATEIAAPVAPAPAVDLKKDSTPPLQSGATQDRQQIPDDQTINVPAARPEEAVTPQLRALEVPTLEKPRQDSKADPMKSEIASTPSPPAAAAAAAAKDEAGASDSVVPTKDGETTESQVAHGRSAKAISRWQRSLLVRLQAARSGIRIAGETGSVEVAFSLDDMGSIASIRVMRGSGSRRLDQAALALVKRASPFPRPPIGVAGGELSFKVPVVFAQPR